MVGNTETRGHSLKVAALPPANSSDSNDVELEVPRTRPQLILPGTNAGGWTLQSAQHASESREEG